MKILFENKHMLVVDKPAGLSVHQGNGIKQETIVGMLRDQIVDSDPVRPGVVHRLDKNTSGVLLLAKDAQTKKYLQRQFKDRKVKKVYQALVYGVPKAKSAHIDVPIGRNSKNPLKKAVKSSGRLSLTTYRTVKTLISQKDGAKYSLLEVTPKTGRTHQIRVHMSYLGHPVVGDKVYGPKTQSLDRLWLHAQKLTIKLPSGETKSFTSQIPAELSEYIKSL